MSNTNIIKLDNTRQSCFNECPRKYQIEYINHLKPTDGSPPLRFGSTYHGMQEGLNIVLQKEGSSEESVTKGYALGLELGRKVWEMESEKAVFPEDHRTLENAERLFKHYIINEKDNIIRDIVVLETEQYMEHEVDVSGEELATHPFLKGKTLIYEGVVDRVASIDNMLAVEDYKTTGMWIGSVMKGYRRSPQLTGYAWLYMINGGDKVYYTTYDINHCSKRTNLTLKTERYPNLLNSKDISRFRNSLITTADRIAYCNEMGHFPKNANTCSGQWGDCRLFATCSLKDEFCLDDFIKDGYTMDKWEPEKKVEEVEKLKKEFL